MGLLVLFVNSLSGKYYGSNCMDCRYALRDRAGALAGLFGEANAAEAGSVGRSGTAPFLSDAGAHC
jgi:hypothetical protein